MTCTQNSLSLTGNQSLGKPISPPSSRLAVSGGRGPTQHWPCGWPTSGRLTERLTRLLLRTCNQGGSPEEVGNDRLHWPAGEGDGQPAYESQLAAGTLQNQTQDGVGHLSAPPQPSPRPEREEHPERARVTPQISPEEGVCSEHL